MKIEIKVTLNDRECDLIRAQIRYQYGSTRKFCKALKPNQKNNTWINNYISTQRTFINEKTYEKYFKILHIPFLDEVFDKKGVGD